ncbi:MAG: hypothetical protein EB060_05245 [Proteobacteria bacterium]|nr:hypothetical protein [Pseudomonadota bacterium]
MSSYLLLLAAISYLSVVLYLSLWSLRHTTFDTNKQVGKQVLKTVGISLVVYILLTFAGALGFVAEGSTCRVFFRGNFVTNLDFIPCFKTNLQTMLLLLVVPFLTGLAISTPIVAWKAAAQVEKARMAKATKKPATKKKNRKRNKR